MKEEKRKRERVDFAMQMRTFFLLLWQKRKKKKKEERRKKKIAWADKIRWFEVDSSTFISEKREREREKEKEREREGERKSQPSESAGQSIGSSPSNKGPFEGWGWYSRLIVSCLKEDRGPEGRKEKERIVISRVFALAFPLSAERLHQLSTTPNRHNVVHETNHLIRCRLGLLSCCC